MLDLRTGLGFHLEDDIGRRAIVATGVLAMRLGRYALVALPSRTELPEARPAPEIVEAARMPTAVWDRRPEARDGLRRSSVTCCPPPPASTTSPGTQRPLDTARSPCGAVEPGPSVELSETALDSGVLLGRAERCEPRLRSVLTESVSRVHLLLLREHGVVHAFDVASMQGVYAAGERVRRVRLPERGGTLRLASKDPVLLEWHPRDAVA